MCWQQKKNGEWMAVLLACKKESEEMFFLLLLLLWNVVLERKKSGYTKGYLKFQKTEEGCLIFFFIIRQTGS